MQNLKRVLSLVLVVAMVAGIMLSAVAAPAEQLTDLADSKFQPEVRILNALGIVEGYEDGTYKPANEVTRAELALILARVRVGGDKEMIRTYNYGHMTYTDILNDGYQWAASGIQYCTDNGMVVGDGNGKYRPGDTVTIVEALKMLLTALGYDAELEGLQNVGAAWKANTLSLAREVGLMDRFYGDTNKNCTRDDIALLIYNFLNSLVVKGYYENTVANVDTWLYNGGTALEVYFNKQIVYGVIVANEKANLENISHATEINPLSGAEKRLQAGYTEIFLYAEADEDGVVLSPSTSGIYFETIKGLSTTLADIGESVFVITDLNPSKGYYEAVGGVCFLTGENTVGVETWKNTATVAPLATANTLYYEDYDAVAAYNPNGNGNFLKTVDFNGDGKLDLVMQEEWTMTFAMGANRAGVVTTIEPATWAAADRDADCATFGYVNYHIADGIIYSVAAGTIAKTALAAGSDAINYAKQYITLADGNKYEQSAINYAGIPGMKLNIMDCVADPIATKNYNWYLDCGGYIRAYGEDNSQYSLYLLTDASCKLNGRVYNKNITVYQKSNEAASYAVAATCGYVATGADLPFDAQLPFTGAVTNLVSGAAADTNMTLTDPSVQNLKLVNLTATAKATQYTAEDGTVTYATTLTDYYIVQLARDILGNVYVAGVEYVQGYANAKWANANTIYAAVTAGAGYYEANTIVVESFDPAVTTAVPVFAYQHTSASTDTYKGLYAIIDNAGSLDATMYVNEYFGSLTTRPDAKLGFFLYNEKKASAALIEKDFNAYGIYAGQIAVELSNRDYIVMDIIGGKQIKITAETPIYALTNYKAGVGGLYEWSILDYTGTGLKVGDQLIYVTNPLTGAVIYALIVNSAAEPVWAKFPTNTWDTTAAQDLYFAILNNDYDWNTDFLTPAVAAFDAATEAWLNAAPADKDAAFDAMVAAFLTAYGYTTDMVQPSSMSDDDFAAANLVNKAGQIKALSEIINEEADPAKKYYDAYGEAVTDVVNNVYNPFKAEMVPVETYKIGGKIRIEQYDLVKVLYDAISDADLDILDYLGIDTSAYDAFPTVSAEARAALANLKVKLDNYNLAAGSGTGAELDAINELQDAWDAWKASANYALYTDATVAAIEALSIAGFTA